MQRSHPDLDFTHPLPYGAMVWKDGVQFVIFSRNATRVGVLLYDAVADREPSEIIELDRSTDRWGDIWSVFVPGIGPGQLYHLQVDGPFDPARGHRFDGNARLIDPYAKALAGECLAAGPDGVVRPPKCVVVDEHFDWEGDRHLRRRLSETVIYEMHVRGFTRSRSSGVEHPGTYLGVIEKIPYLQSLGVTAVELMPVHEFPTTGWYGAKEPHPNYWGYDPLAFFAPHRGYASSDEPGAQVREFKQMVKELHRAGIEVILDVVFNHTAEGNHLGPTLSFKGLENSVYYMLDPHGGYKNYTGCGNTVNGNHPVVREMIFHCLRHWVHNYHIDGFRFDLASILSPQTSTATCCPTRRYDRRHRRGSPTGRHQDHRRSVGRRGGVSGRLLPSELPLGRVERPLPGRRPLTFWRGDHGSLGDARHAASPGRATCIEPARPPAPTHSINIITTHDGFTLNDLTSYCREAQRSQWRRQPRRRQQQPQRRTTAWRGPTRRKNASNAYRLRRQIKNDAGSTLML